MNIDFACKRFELSQIIKCVFGMTRMELDIFYFFLQQNEEISAKVIAQKKKLDITTVQKALKKFTDKGLLVRRQINLDKGGFSYVYQLKSRVEIQRIISKTLTNWTKNVMDELQVWCKTKKSH